jgi:preprotein translocase subunit SecG
LESWQSAAKDSPTDKMIYVLTAIHVIVCVFLIIVVLLQSGKSADLAGAFGGTGSQSTFGPRGAASALSRATTGAVIVFMLTSLALSIMASRKTSGVGGGSVLQGTPSKPATPQQSAPAQPATPPTNPK